MIRVRLGNALLLAAACAAPVAAQTPAPQKASAPSTATRPSAAAPAIAPGVATPPDYVIGADDVLTIVFWRDKDMSGDVGVRPDGKISVPLLNDVQAAGLTPEQLRSTLTSAAGKFLEDPNVTVVVKTINSRRVFITGNIAKPGPYPLTNPTTVLQLVATAGGLLEYAHSDKIVVMRTDGANTQQLPFNYREVTKGKKLQQNVLLKPGDTVIVP